MSSVWVKHLVIRNPNSQAEQCFLPGEVIIDSGSVRIPSEDLWNGCERGQHRLMYLAQTDAECGLSCHQFPNVGYQGTHGGPKVARDPGGRKADGPIFHISGRSAYPFPGRSPTLSGQNMKYLPQNQVPLFLTSLLHLSAAMCSCLYYTDDQKGLTCIWSLQEW